MIIYYLLPIGSMYGIFTYIYIYIYHNNQPNVGKYTIPMDPFDYGNQHVISSKTVGNYMELP